MNFPNDRIEKIILLCLVIALFSLVSSASADDNGVGRSTPSSVYSSGEFDVRLNISGSWIGGIVETLPDNFSFVSTTYPEGKYNCSGQHLIFSVINDDTITYTVKAPDRTGSGKFTGIWYDSYNNINGTIGELEVAVKMRGGDGGDDDDDSYSQTTTKTGKQKDGTLDANSRGIVNVNCEFASKNGNGFIRIKKGVSATDKNGKPLKNVEIKAIKQSEIPATNSGNLKLSPYRAYECSPSGAVFDPPVELVLKLTDDGFNTTDEDRHFVIKWFNAKNNSWEELETTLNPKERTVTALISHFSIFALFETATEPDTTTTTVTKAPATEVVSTTPVSTEKTDTQKPAKSETKTDASANMPVFIGIILILGIGACALYISMNKKDNEGGK